MGFTPHVQGLKHTRREWLKAATAAGILATAFPATAAWNRAVRSFHVCLAPEIVESDADLLRRVRDAGVSTVWLAGFCYGHHPYANALLGSARKRLREVGLSAQLINLPLGHPGDSLGATAGGFPLTPPAHWQLGHRPDGSTLAGTSLHAPATDENARALRSQRQLGFRQCFLDDDFRLARGPGEIGGCFCPAHQERFLRAGGYTAGRWAELLDDVQARRLSTLLRAWLDFTCDELTASFRTQQKAYHGALGIMVMYLGAEKAGIRLQDYRHALFRVGELMFNDHSFTPVKGKTDELFSALFHQRFAAPERSFSETTAFPADRLSAVNMAAKLTISTLADVRQTMFMSGLTPFPREHWNVLGPAMKQQAQMHAAIAGHRLRGPFKHFWGEAQRMVGDDQPFSLWLALGVPFEVVEAPAKTGWTFLSDFDACELARQTRESPQRLVCRTSATSRPPGVEVVGETLTELFGLKNRLRDKLRDVPHVAENEPAVCAWYPTTRKVLVWNLSVQPRALTIVLGARRFPLRLPPLAAAVTEVAAPVPPS